MADSNKTRMKKKKEEARNRAAFVEVIGDPYSDIDGVYSTLHCRSSVGSIENKFGEASETISPCKPTVSDFFCDVENVLNTVIDDLELIDRFFRTYFNNEDLLDKPLRKKLEQSIGRVLRARGISPVKSYFTVIHE